MRRLLAGVPLFFTVFLFSVPPAAAQENWSQFRGPRADGVGTADNLPVEFGEEKNVTWKTAIHGKGWASPVVWGNQVWTATATEDGKELFAVCVDLKTGEIIHDVKVFDVAEPEFCHPTNSYASCTPTVEEGRVYVHFGSYGTACLDTATGKTLWERRDLPCDHFRGPASSPTLFGDLLFLNFDGFDVQYVVALNKKTGKTVWKKDRDIDYGTDNGDYKKAYGTSMVFELGGRQQLVSPAAFETIAYDVQTGDQLWKVRHEGTNAAAPPILADGLLYLCVGSGGGMLAVRPDENAEQVQIEWKYAKSVPKRGSPLLFDGLLYLFNDSGVATCLDARTGDEVWQTRIDGSYWSSPVAADGKIFACSQEGHVNVLAPGREFKLLAANQFESGFNASPAIADNALFVRSFTHLYRIEE